MKYYKFKKQVWYGRMDKYVPITDAETEKAYGFLRRAVDIHGEHKEIWVPKSICKVEDVETNTKNIDMYGDVEYVHGTLHIITFYIPKWFFGKNRLYITIGELVSQNNCYDLEEVELED